MHQKILVDSSQGDQCSRANHASSSHANLNCIVVVNRLSIASVMEVELVQTKVISGLCYGKQLSEKSLTGEPHVVKQAHSLLTL